MARSRQSPILKLLKSSSHTSGRRRNSIFLFYSSILLCTIFTLPLITSFCHYISIYLASSSAQVLVPLKLFKFFNFFETVFLSVFVFSSFIRFSNSLNVCLRSGHKHYRADDYHLPLRLFSLANIP